MTAASYEDLARQLSEGLNLCVRARELESHDRTAAMVSAFPSIDLERAAPGLNALDPDMPPYRTRSLTIPLWVEEQYQRDLAAWERTTREMLSRLDLEAYATPRSAK